MRRALPLLLLVLLVVPSTARAGSISARMDRTEVAVGQSVMMYVEVSGEFDRLPTLPEPDGLKVEAAERREAYALSRGRMSAVVTIGYRVTGSKEGSWILGPARVTVDGQSKASESFEVVVTPASAGRAAPSGGARSTRGRTSRGRAAPQAAVAKPGEDYYAVAALNHERPYVGQSVTLDVEVFRKVATTSGPIQWEQPELGTMSREPGTRALEDDERRMIDGYDYWVRTIRLPLFPVEAGAARIGATTGYLGVPKVRRVGFVQQAYRETVAAPSNPVQVDVRALPRADRPDDFNGVVGDFRLEVKLSRASVETGQTTTLTVRATGYGSLRGKELALPLPDGFEVFPENAEVDYRMRDRGLWTEVDWQYHLLSREPGIYEIPPVELPHFDPKKGRYVVARSEPLRLIVTGETLTEEAVVSRSASLVHAKEEVEVLGTDILPLHSGPRLQGDARLGFRSPLVLGLLLLPLIGFCGLAARASRDRLAGTAGGRRKLRRRAAKRS